MQHLKALLIGQGGNAFVEAGGDKLLSVQLLTMATTGFPAKLELYNNDMILDYAPGSPVQTTFTRNLITARAMAEAGAASASPAQPPPAIRNTTRRSACSRRRNTNRSTTRRHV